MSANDRGPASPVFGYLAARQITKARQKCRVIV
jgi:hypothetical protein